MPSWFRRPKEFAYTMPGFDTPEGRQAQSLGIMLVAVLLFMGSITAGVVALIVPVPPEPSGFGVTLRGGLGPGLAYRITVQSTTRAVSLSQFAAELRGADASILSRMDPLESVSRPRFSFFDINQRGLLDVGDSFDIQSCQGAPEPLQFRLLRGTETLSTITFNDPC